MNLVRILSMFQENGYGTYLDEPSTSEHQYQQYSRVRIRKIHDYAETSLNNGK